MTAEPIRAEEKEKKEKGNRAENMDVMTARPWLELLCLCNPLKTRKNSDLFLIDFLKKRGQYLSAPPILSKQPKDLNQAEDEKKPIMQPSLRSRMGCNLTENEYKKKKKCSQRQKEVASVALLMLFLRHQRPQQLHLTSCWPGTQRLLREHLAPWLFVQTTCISQLAG